MDRQTDGRTDRILIARPRLHSMQRGKNHVAYTSEEGANVIRTKAGGQTGTFKWHVERLTNLRGDENDDKKQTVSRRLITTSIRKKERARWVVM